MPSLVGSGLVGCEIDNIWVWICMNCLVHKNSIITNCTYACNCWDRCWPTIIWCHLHMDEVVVGDIGEVCSAIVVLESIHEVVVLVPFVVPKFRSPWVEGLSVFWDKWFSWDWHQNMFQLEDEPVFLDGTCPLLDLVRFWAAGCSHVRFLHRPTAWPTDISCQITVCNYIILYI